MPSTKGFTRCNYPPEILWRNPEETGRAAIMKNEMAFVLLDEKISFYKVSSTYTAKFLAGHYIIGELLSNDVLPC
jgi:hypothetical protein